MPHRTAYFSWSLMLLFLLLLPAPGQAADGTASPRFWPVTLQNNSGSAITGITFTPLNNDLRLSAAGPTTEERQRVENRAAGVFQRPSSDLVRIVIQTEAGVLSFLYVSYFQEKDTTAELSLSRIKAPELVLYRGTEVSARFSGHNSVWGVSTPLGAFPYGPGQTRLAQAEALGGLKAGKNPAQRTGSIEWDNDQWDTTLAFDGASPDSLLVSVRMSIQQDRDHIQVENSLINHEYMPIRVSTGKSAVELPAFAVTKNQPLNADLQELACEQLRSQLKKEGQHLSFVISYVPRAVAEAMLKAAQDGAPPLAALEKARDATVVTVVDEGATTMLCTVGAWLEKRCLPLK